MVCPTPASVRTLPNGSRSLASNQMHIAMPLFNILNGTELDQDLIGNFGPDRISGFGGNDVLLGGLGIDIVDGGTGAVVMQGGVGDDLYRVDNFADAVSEESAGSGIDDGGIRLSSQHRRTRHQHARDSRRCEHDPAARHQRQHRAADRLPSAVGHQSRGGEASAIRACAPSPGDPSPSRR